VGKTHNQPFRGVFLRGPRLFLRLNCPEQSEGKFRRQKSRGPLKKPKEMADYVFFPTKKHKIPNF
jgi:hypothetical protein